MTEIPEHLRKRAEAARAKAAAESASSAPAAATPAGGEAAEASEPAAADPRIPAHLLERSRAAKAKAEVIERGFGDLAHGAACAQRLAADQLAAALRAFEAGDLGAMHGAMVVGARFIREAHAARYGCLVDEDGRTYVPSLGEAGPTMPALTAD